MSAVYEMLAPSGLEILSNTAVFVPPAFNDNSRKMQAQLPAVGIVSVAGIYRAGQPVRFSSGVIGMTGTFCGVLVENTRMSRKAAVQFYGAAWVLSHEPARPTHIGKFLTFNGEGGGVVSEKCQYFNDNIGNITGVVSENVYEVMLKSRCGQVEPIPPLPIRAAQLTGGHGNPGHIMTSGNVTISNSTVSGTLATGAVTTNSDGDSVIELNETFLTAVVSGGVAARISGSTLIISAGSLSNTTFYITGAVIGEAT